MLVQPQNQIINEASRRQCTSLARLRPDRQPGNTLLDFGDETREVAHEA